MKNLNMSLGAKLGTSDEPTATMTHDFNLAGRRPPLDRKQAPRMYNVVLPNVVLRSCWLSGGFNVEPS